MRYESVTLSVAAASVGVVLLLMSLGYLHSPTLASIPLLAVGGWTLAYGVLTRQSHYGVWGGLTVGVGLALLLERVTGNLLLNFAALVIATSIAALILARGKG